MRLSAIILQGRELDANKMPIAAISPDGAILVYAATTKNQEQLYLQHMKQKEAVALANTIGLDTPGIFSPDGRWIAFAQQGKLKKIPVLGGSAQTICDAAQLRGLHWGDNDKIAFAPTRRSGSL